MTKKLHWTQTPEGKARLSAAMKLSHSRVKEVKRSVVKEKRKYAKKSSGESALVVNGWRIVLGKDAIRIEKE